MLHAVFSGGKPFIFLKLAGKACNINISAPEHDILDLVLRTGKLLLGLFQPQTRDILMIA